MNQEKGLTKEGRRPPGRFRCPRRSSALLLTRGALRSLSSVALSSPRRGCFRINVVPVSSEEDGTLRSFGVGMGLVGRCSEQRSRSFPAAQPAGRAGTRARRFSGGRRLPGGGGGGWGWAGGGGGC